MGCGGSRKRRLQALYDERDHGAAAGLKGDDRTADQERKDLSGRYRSGYEEQARETIENALNEKYINYLNIIFFNIESIMKSKENFK